MTEFMALTEKPEFRHMLSILELDVGDAEKLFIELADDDGSLVQDVFIEGIMDSRGAAKAIDLATVLHLSHKMHDELREIQALLDPKSARSRIPMRKLSR